MPLNKAAHAVVIKSTRQPLAARVAITALINRRAVDEMSVQGSLEPQMNRMNKLPPDA
jgi:hypothetical protein